MCDWGYSHFLFWALPSVVSEWYQELAIAPHVRLGKNVESGKPGEREIYNPEVALVGLGHLTLNLVRCDPACDKQKRTRCVLDDRSSARQVSVPFRVRLSQARRSEPRSSAPACGTCW